MVVAVALKVTLGLHGTFDVYFDDETIYLDGAHHLGTRFLPLAESSPLYPMWYRAIGIFEPDPLKLYFTNWFVLTLSLPIVLYALARRSGAPLSTAMAVAIAWSLSSTAMTWPYVGKFAALVLGLGALASTSARDARIGVALGSCALSAAGYARPELLLPSLAFAALVVAWTLASIARPSPSRPRRDGAIALALASAAPIGLHAAFGRFGNPFAYGRQFFAFGQHYALNVVEARGLAIDPWTSWSEIARAAFPKAQSIAAAARENPSAFDWHVRRNLTLLPAAIRALLQPLPHEPKPIHTIVAVALGLTVVAALVAIARRRSLQVPPALLRWAPMLAFVTIAAGASAVLVHPRQHYLLPLAFLALAAVAAVPGPLAGVQRPIGPRKPSRGVRAAALVGAVYTLAAVPTARRGLLPAIFDAVGPPPLPESAQENRATIHALRRLGLVSLPWGPIAPRADWMPTVVLLEPDYSRGVYAFYNFKRIEQWQKTIPFWEFVRVTWTNVVVLNARARTDAHLRDDPDFVAFADGTGEREDFERIPVSGTSVVLAVRRSLLQWSSSQANR